MIKPTTQRPKSYQLCSPTTHQPNKECQVGATEYFGAAWFPPRKKNLMNRRMKASHHASALRYQMLYFCLRFATQLDATQLSSTARRSLLQSSRRRERHASARRVSVPTPPNLSGLERCRIYRSRVLPLSARQSAITSIDSSIVARTVSALRLQ